MSSNTFTKENLDSYLKELAKEFKKRNGKTMAAEIILVGGAAILANYGFREMTTDIDAIIHAASSMKDAANCVRDKYDLPHGWLNTDFIHTGSYSPKLDEFSVYYKNFYGVMTVRTVRAAYLIAMKLRSGRKYKNDLSDIVGILAEHEKRGEPLAIEQIDTAMVNLYGGWDDVSQDSKLFIKQTMENGKYRELYLSVKAEEKASKDILVDFENKYPKVATESNVNDILAILRERQRK